MTTASTATSRCCLAAEGDQLPPEDLPQQRAQDISSARLILLSRGSAGLSAAEQTAQQAAQHVPRRPLPAPAEQVADQATEQVAVSVLLASRQRLLRNVTHYDRRQDRQELAEHVSAKTTKTLQTLRIVGQRVLDDLASVIGVNVRQIHMITERSIGVLIQRLRQALGAF